MKEVGSAPGPASPGGNRVSEPNSPWLIQEGDVLALVAKKSRGGLTAGTDGSRQGWRGGDRPWRTGLEVARRFLVMSDSGRAGQLPACLNPSSSTK